MWIRVCCYTVRMKKTELNPPTLLQSTLYAQAGILTLVPFILLNSFIGNRIPPLYAFIRPGVQTGTFGYIVLMFALYLIPLGIGLAVYPMIHKHPSRRGDRHSLNTVVVVVLFCIFFFLSWRLASAMIGPVTRAAM